MGAYLNKPITEKETETGGNARVKYAATSMQGWRVNQEDAHNCIADLLNGWSMFAVYDGHGGPEVAKYTAEKFPAFLLNREFWTQEDVEKTLREIFIDFDDHLREDATLKQLRVIAGHVKQKKKDVETDEDKAQMYDEASLPLQELLKKYGVQLLPGGGGGIAGTLLDAGEESEEDEEADEEEAEEDDEEGESGDPEAACTTENDDNKKNSAKRSCDSPHQEDVKRPKTEESGAEVEVKQNGEAKTECGEEVKAAPKMREKKSNELKVKEKVEVPLMDSDADSSDDEDFDINQEESEEEESEEEACEIEMEEEVFAPSGEVPGEDSGTTACVCLMSDTKILVANVGDSRAVLCRGGKAVDLSFDHKPEDEIESTRIVKAGGRVSEDGRVNGGLNLSRAFGDHVYKKNSSLRLEEQMISALPDVKIEDLTPDDQFLVVACDGIWNSMDSQQVIDFVKKRFEDGDELQKIVEAMCMECLAENTAGDGTGCDNMTVIIVDLIAKKAVSA